MGDEVVVLFAVLAGLVPGLAAGYSIGRGRWRWRLRQDAADVIARGNGRLR